MGSLLYQMTRAIDKNFTPGKSKRSHKKQGIKKVLIFSYSYRRNLIHFSANLTHFLKGSYKVRNLKDIKPEFITAFFKAKEDLNCSHRTLVQYKSYITTMDKLITQTYYFKLHMARGVPEVLGGTKPKRTLYMRQEHIDAILELRKNSNSAAVLGIRINNLFGLRVSETCKLIGKDFDLDKMVLHIVRSKGGRDRDIKINTVEQLELAREIRAKYGELDKLVPMEENSFNKFITEALEELGITMYKDANTVNHAIRKKVARKVLQDNLDKGMSMQDAMDDTSKFLGHNKNRNRVVSIYTNAE